MMQRIIICFTFELMYNEQTMGLLQYLATRSTLFDMEIPKFIPFTITYLVLALLCGSVKCQWTIKKQWAEENCSVLNFYQCQQIPSDDFTFPLWTDQTNPHICQTLRQFSFNHMIVHHSFNSLRYGEKYPSIWV